jgi:adenylate cyclase
MYTAWSLWHQGYPDQALEMSGKAVERALRVNHMHGIAVARAGSCVVRLLRKDGEALKEADALIAFATEHGFPYWRAMGSILRSRALLEGGSAAEALKGLSEIIPRLRNMGARVGLPSSLAALAEAYGKIGDPEAGLAVIADTLAEIDQTSERNCEAQLYRLKGELLLTGEKPSRVSAENCLRRAVEIARKFDAKSWELCATMSLSRLLNQQGRRDEARLILTGIYSWFTEGFDTGDMKEAKALLDELRS